MPQASRARLWLVLAAAALAAVPATASLAADDVPPVTKVVQLLQELQQGLETEAKEDQETYESLQCWCKKNGAEKTEAVEVAKQAIDSMQSKVEGGSGRTGELGAELEHLRQRIAEDEAALNEAIEIRKKEAAEFHEQEVDLISSIRLLDGAIQTLAKHHPAMLQEDAAALQALRPKLRHLVHKNIGLLSFLRNSADKDALLALLDANPDILEDDHLHREGPPLDDLLPPMLLQAGRRLRRQPAGYKSYAPQSGQILGVLKQMKEAFEEDLPQIQKGEQLRVEQYSLMTGAKESQIASEKSAYKEKGGDLANTKEGMWTNRDDLKDAKASLAADEAFLKELTVRCDAGDREYEKRVQMRSEEIKAVSEAIEILTADEARDGQQTTWGPASFLQLQLARESAGRREVVTLAQASVARFPDFALLAEAARDQPFKKVMQVIDDLVAKLKQQQADEVKFRDFCIDAFHENQVDTERKTAEHQDLLAKAEELLAYAENLNKELEQLKADIANLHLEMQRAAEDRQKENHQFKQVFTDQKNVQNALKGAMSKLAAVFEKRGGFLQQRQEPEFHERGSGPRPTVAPAPEFQDYDTKSGSTTGVLGLIQKLIGEAQVLIDASKHDEQNAQASYETLIGETNDSVKAKSRQVTDKTEELANTEEELHMTNADAERVGEDLKALAESKAALHKQCDFLMKNFDARQKARGDEMVALGEAKAIVAGMASKC